MINAREEFLDEIRGKDVKCCVIHYCDEYYEEKRKTFRLRENCTEAELEYFLRSLDFTYDAGYGGQEIFGTIWYDDGTWSERGEYDGSEWWSYKSCPKIPEELVK